MKIDMKNGRFTVWLGERIDTNNSKQTQDELDNALHTVQGQDISELVMDAERLNYISSSGLRVLVRLVQRTGKKLLLRNVCQEVYDIFETVGFTKMFDVRRKPREISIEGCSIIGRGGYGTVYRLDEDKILKLYRPSQTLEDIERERLLVKEAFVSGIPSVIAYDTVRCGDSFGIVFEMLEADTLGHAFAKSPDKTEEYIARYVDFVKHLHSIPVSSAAFPKLKIRLHEMVPPLEAYCSQEELALLHALIHSIPDRETLIHGDLHPGNIMLQGDEFVLIDLPDASIGSKVWDLIALFRDLIVGPRSIPDVIQESVGLPADRIADIGRSFFMRYFGAENEGALQRYLGMLMPLFALNTVLTSGSPSDTAGVVSGEQVRNMMKGAIIPNEMMIRQALRMLS